jgi:deoxyribodipyrimidine photo-lyase
MSDHNSLGIHWFRRDLRVHGNPALQANWRQHQGRVLGLFSLDRKFLARADFSHRRFAFFLATLKELRADLRARGGDLLVVDEDPCVAWAKILEYIRLKTPYRVESASWNHDYEPFARARDSRIQHLLERAGVQILSRRDHLLVEPHELLKDDGTPYRVFTPFYRRWVSLFYADEMQKRLRRADSGLQSLAGHVALDPQLFSTTWKVAGRDDFPYVDALETFILENAKRVDIPIPAAGTKHAFEAMMSFKSRVPDYGTTRDLPGRCGTSRVSPFLKNGSLTTAMLIRYLGLEPQKHRVGTGAEIYLRELAWREFYYHILYHWPAVETEPFNSKYAKLKWGNRQDWFERWQQGKTGYPIVDAGMRELLRTGWMHNRLRMIVASFLTKDLLIDWRWGERHFMNLLLDGDLAPNNGGWQWAASTGCDPQPYFRVFNPLLQSRRFDPEGTYIRQYVPELRHLSAEDIHEPVNRASYPDPIVDHSEQKVLAIRMFKAPDLGA